jgi:hypothetical protein
VGVAMDPAEEPRRPKVKDLRHRAQSTLFNIGSEFKDAPESAIIEEASENGSDIDGMDPEAEELMEGMAEWCALLSETVLGKYCICSALGVALPVTCPSVCAVMITCLSVCLPTCLPCDSHRELFYRFYLVEFISWIRSNDLVLSIK